MTAQLVSVIEWPLDCVAHAAQQRVVAFLMAALYAHSYVPDAALAAFRTAVLPSLQGSR